MEYVLRKPSETMRSSRFYLTEGETAGHLCPIRRGSFEFEDFLSVGE